MHKIVIIIEQPDDWQRFEAAWPDFLHQVETMPGLLRESTSRVDHFLYGDCQVSQVHELYFSSLKAAVEALSSPQGQAAGRLIQTITQGRMILFIADHKEDDLANILSFKSAGSV